MLRLDKTELGLLAIAVLLLAGGTVLPDWLTFLLTIALGKALAVQGVVMQMRAGLVSFGQGLFYCVGGYAVGMGGMMLGIKDAFLLLALGVVVAVALAGVLGLLLTRYRDIFFAMLSLAFSMILFGVLVKSAALGSSDGFNVVSLTFLGWAPTGNAQRLTVFGLTVLVALIVALLLHRYFRAPVGYVCEAIRENEVRVEYLGLSSRGVLHANYIFAAAVTALGGGLTAFATGHIDPEMAFWTTSGEFVFIALLGGTSHVAAPFIAAILFSVIRTYAIQFTPHTWQMILGVVLLAIILFLPKGLWSLFQRRKPGVSA